MRSRLRILLCTALTATGMGHGDSCVGAEGPGLFVVAADTLHAMEHDGLLRGHRPWTRSGSGRRHWVGWDSLPRGPDRSVALTSAWNGTRTADEPTADPNLYGANGNVLAVARAGNMLYIGGSFRSVGRNQGGFAVLDSRMGEARPCFPKVAGSVYAIVPDGSGGCFIGGEFTGVGAKARSCMAQIRADGSVTDWNPSVTGSPGYIDPPSVSAIAVCGGRVFFGGGFREIGGQPHENFGCVDARTGAVLDWNLDVTPEGWIYALAVHDSIVFVGGGFSSIGGQPRSSLAAVSGHTGRVLPWRADAFGGVYSLLACGDALFVGGDFLGIAGSTRNMLAAVDVHTGLLLPFDARPTGVQMEYVRDPWVAALALLRDTLYVGGNFTEIGGRPLESLAALSATTGDALAWTPPVFDPHYSGWPPQACYALAVNGGTLHVGGSFETAGGVSRPFAAAMDRATGELADWNPKPDLPIYALMADGGAVYAGGDFSLLGEWQHRAGLAAINLTTGALKPWNPNPDGEIVTAIAVDGPRVLVSGDFATIGGDPQPRDHFAALDTVNGEILDWDPGANSLARAFVLRGDTLYAGGEFTEVGGQARSYLAAINATTGEVTTWDPSANLPVLTLAHDGNTVYAGGLFDRIGSSVRRGIAGLDAITGELKGWNPAPDIPLVESLLLRGSVLYAGGAFGSIGGQPRSGLAALDLVTGAATSWDPNPAGWTVVSARIRALVGVDSLLYVGGNYGLIGGESRICLAAVDTVTGHATDWDPGLDGYVWSLAAEGSTLYVGGGFTRAGGVPCTGLAAFTIPAASPSPGVARLALSVMPNPAHNSAVARFALPIASAVSLGVYDLQGRRVTTVLHRDVRAAGTYDVPVSTSRWREGIYFWRLEVDGATITSKVVVVQ